MVLPNTFTFEAWVLVPQADTTGSGNLVRPIFAKYDKPNNADNNAEFVLRITPDGYFEVIMGTGSDLGVSLKSITQLSDNTWYHVAVVVTQNSGVSPSAVKLYLDGGALEAQTTTWSSANARIKNNGAELGKFISIYSHLINN